MTRLIAPGARRVAAAWCAVACLGLAACSGGTSSTHPPSKSPSPSPTGQPTSGPAGTAAVRNLWLTFFDGSVPIPKRLPLLQGYQQFAPFVHSQEKTTLGALVFSASATVSSVTLQPPGRADLVYTILLSGKPLEKNLHGQAVYVDGKWEVADATFCGLIKLAYGATSHLIPAACRS